MELTRCLCRRSQAGAIVLISNNREMALRAYEVVADCLESRGVECQMLHKEDGGIAVRAGFYTIPSKFSCELPLHPHYEWHGNKAYQWKNFHQ